MKWQLYLVLTAVLCLAACGTPGAPRPPSLELPRPAADLAATRQGDKITLTWTAPRETTDKQNIRHPGPVRICRGVNTTAMVQCPQVAELPAAPAVAKGAKPEQRTYADTLPMNLQQQNPTGFATYALESLNGRGRSAGLSNHVEVPLAPTLPPPEKVVGSVTAQGPVIGWSVPLNEINLIMLPRATKQSSPVAYDFRLYRRDKQQPNVMPVAIPIENAYASPLLPQPNENVLDPTAEWEHTYQYWVTVVTTVNARGGSQEVEGEASPIIEVFVHDVFPPAAPAGLQAVASGVGQPPFVDLTWAPNTEADLAGYNVYRRQAGQPPVKISTELVKAPAYRDREVTAGHNYFYAVTAVDLRGNESPRSDETSESLP
jgi:hypothetical protein